MSNIMTFDKGFVDAEGNIADGGTNVVEHQGVGNKAQVNLDSSLDGFPAIIFYVPSSNPAKVVDPAVMWVYATVEDRNAGYEEIIGKLKKD